uniref:Uncharacterized protein n=1 Tax=Romanomermis culicivorax TaxID=13658 RepID=A0A915KMS3_ROMCU
METRNTNSHKYVRNESGCEKVPSYIKAARLDGTRIKNKQKPSTIGFLTVSTRDNALSYKMLGMGRIDFFDDSGSGLTTADPDLETFGLADPDLEGLIRPDPDLSI